MAGNLTTLEVEGPSELQLRTIAMDFWASVDDAPASGLRGVDGLRRRRAVLEYSASGSARGASFGRPWVARLRLMDLYEVMRTTAAVREFTDAPLPDEVLHTILENARFAPSGGNRQGSQIVVVRDPATRDRLVEITEPGARRYHAQRAAGETPWSAHTPSRVTDKEVAETRVPSSVTEPLRRAAVVLVVCVDLRAVAALDKELDRVGIVGGASVYPLVWNILLAARNEGFGGTITTMAVAEEPALKRLLGIPEPFAVAAVVPLGKPVRQLKRLNRIAVDELTHLEHWDGGPLLAES